MFKEIISCRICGNDKLAIVLDLGCQAHTGVFPKPGDKVPDVSPLELVKCMEGCGLVQLKHTFCLEEMYGDKYGYRSSLNNAMIKHLQGIYEKNLSQVDLEEDDLIIDIGSNDCTYLKFYDSKKYKLVGIDPTAEKFKEYYPEHIKRIPDFFSAGIVIKNFGQQKAKIITSFAMLYDLEEPLVFVKSISEILHQKGIWVFEQSYMPTMIENNAYDTICHEHLEYYGMKQIKLMLDKFDMTVVDFELTNTNGGSIKIVASKSGKECTEKLVQLLEKEKKYDKLYVFEEFADRVKKHKNELSLLLNKLQKEGKTVFGYGASTKGNVILQYCGFEKNGIPYIAEVNEDKFGASTPGTNIPIISEADAKKIAPDYFIVLPWHFKKYFLEKEKKYLENGGKFIFPLPSVHIVDRSNMYY